MKLLRVLLFCLLLVGCASATSLQFDFQKSAEGWTSSYGTPWSAVDYQDDFAIKTYQTPWDSYIYPAPSVYFSTTYIAFSAKSRPNGWADEHQYITLLNSANGSIGSSLLIDAPDYNWHRYEFIKNNLYFDYYRDGVYVNHYYVGSTTVYRFVLTAHTGGTQYYWYVDDVAINGDSPHVLSSIPSDTTDLSTNWYLKKDYLDPSNLGLYDSTDTLIYTNTMHSSFGRGGLIYPATTWQVKTTHVDTGTLIDTTTLSGYCGRTSYNTTALFFSRATQLYGWYRQELVGDGHVYDINYFPYIATGGTVTFNDTAYQGFEDASVSWMLTSMEPGYEYSCKIISLDTGTELTSWSISSLSGSQDVDLATVPLTAPYAVYLLVTDTDGVEYVINTDIATISVTSRFNGHVYDAETGAVLTSATVGFYQSGVWYNTTTDGSGDYSIDGCSILAPITANAGKTGYTHSDYPFIIYENNEYDIDLYMIPTAPAHTGTAINGIVYQAGLHQAVPSATVTLDSVTPVTANAVGYYVFNSTTASAAHTVSATHASYGTSSTYSVTTGGVGTVTYQGIEIPASYAVNVSAYDYDTHAMVTDSVTFTITGTPGTYTSIGTGTATISVPFGFYSVSTVSANYYAETTTAFVYENRSVSIYIDRIPSTSSSSGVGIQYPPHQVRFVLIDYYGNPITDATVVATAVSTTMGEWDWLASLFGINTDTVQIQNETMTGVTGLDGSLDFVMMESVKYSLHITRTSGSIDHTVSLFPHESEIFIRVPTINAAEPTPRSNEVAYNFSSTEQTNSSALLRIIYADKSSTTNSISFFVQNVTGVNVTSTDVSDPGTYTWSYMLPYSAGAVYYWGFNASLSDGTWINETKVTTFKNNVPLTGVDSSMVSWIAMGVIFLVGMMFSKGSIPTGLIVVGVVSAFFVYIGWVQLIGGFTIPSAIGFIGGMLYMTDRSREVDNGQ